MNRVGMLYGKNGDGKTVNSVRVNAKKKILLSIDYAAVVLNNFPEYTKGTEIRYVEHYTDKDNLGKPREGFKQVFEKAVADKPDVIIIDNISSLFEKGILELNERSKDPRRDYLIVYQDLKRLVYQANELDCDVLFLAWEKVDEIPTETGEIVHRARPDVPDKILSSLCGLCQIVGKVRHTDKGYYFDYSNAPYMYGKDQLYLRKNGLPENLFDGKDRKPAKENAA